MARNAQVSPWKAVGQAVRDTRTRRGMTQQALAAKAGVSLSTVNALETAKRDSYQMMKVGAIFRALGLPTSDLNALLDDGSGRTHADDPRIEALRNDLENAPLSDRVRQTILTLIDAELR